VPARGAPVSVSLRPAVAGDADELARLRWEFRIEDDTQASMTFVEFLAGFRRFATRALGDPERWRIRDFVTGNVRSRT
jgi:hypothetical protein